VQHDHHGAAGSPLASSPNRRIASALETLKAKGLAHPEIHGDGPLRRSAAETDDARRFADLNLHGPHDLRHTFATWLEDAGIPSRVIDEVMGHAGGRHLEQGSRMGRVYRETTPEMLMRVIAAIETRLAVALCIAERREPPNDGVANQSDDSE